MKIPFLLLLLAAPHASARLGETIAQCTARYGKETRILKDAQGDIHEYFKAGFEIGIKFDEGKAVFIAVKKPAKGIMGISAAITPAELEAMISANGRGSAWTKMEDIDLVNDKWISDDRRGFAMYDTLKHTLALTDSAYMLRMQDLEEQRQKDNLKGF